MLSLMILPLLFGSPNEATPAPAPASAVTEHGYAELVAEFDEAEARYKAAYKAETDKKKRRELRKQKPAAEFYERFAALAEGGEGRAYLWLLDNVRDAGKKMAEADELKVAWIEALHADHLAADWMQDAVPVVFKEHRLLDEAKLEAFARGIATKNSDPVTGAVALATLASTFERSKDEKIAKKGTELYKEIQEKYPEEVLSQAITGQRFVKMFLQKGRVAPNFTTEDVDGVEFQLSDYRGNVTLIDFWGFW